MRNKNYNIKNYFMIPLLGISLSCSNIGSSDPKSVAEVYFKSIKNQDLNDFKESISEGYKSRLNDRRYHIKNKNLSPEEDALKYLKESHYHSNTISIESSIPLEIYEYEKDLEEIVWARHEGCGYHEVILANETGKWKVTSIGRHFNF
jgi:hypothetical protein